MVTHSPGETLALAARIGRRLSGGEVFALTGELGSGKTCFAKGLARGLGIDPREVTSPTFLLLHEIPGRLLLRHVDAYRVRDPEELLEIGLAECFDGRAVVLVEWADRVEPLLPGERLEVALSVEGETRRALRFRVRGRRVPPWFPGAVEEEGR